MARKPKRKPPPPPQRRPSGRVVVLAFAAAIAVAVSFVVFAVVSRSSDDDSSTSPTPGAIVDFSGIPQDGVFLGPPDARVTLIEYADLQCPACRAYAASYLPALVEQYVRPGRVRAEFRGIAFLGPDSETALRYVLAAGLQDRLWELQEAMYRNQGGENSGWVSEALLRTIASDIEGLDVDRVLADAQSEQVTAMISQATAQAQAAEVPGTPSLAIQVGNEEPDLLDSGTSLSELSAALDQALAG
jgi:protein-disulfide isomerase